MGDILQLLEAKVKSGLLLCRSRIAYDSLHLNPGSLRAMPVDYRPGAADEILGKRVPVFRESEGDRNKVTLN